MFGEVHWYLAIFYLRIAKNTPRVINGQADQVKSYKRILIVGAVFNALFPCLELVTWITGNIRNKNGNGGTSWLGYDIAMFGLSTAWVVSGCVLIWSIVATRNFLKSRNIEGQVLNIKTLVLHSAAFGLFAASVIVNEVFYFYEQFVSAFSPNNP